MTELILILVLILALAYEFLTIGLLLPLDKKDPDEWKKIQGLKDAFDRLEAGRHTTQQSEKDETSNRFS